MSSRETADWPNVLPRETTNIAHVSMDLVSAIAFNEEALQSSLRNVLLDRARVNSCTRVVDYGFA